MTPDWTGGAVAPTVRPCAIFSPCYYYDGDYHYGMFYSSDHGETWHDSGYEGSVLGVTQHNGFIYVATQEDGILRSEVPHVVGVRHIEAVPTGIALSQNYPNPVTGSTTIPFSLNTASDVTLEVYNTLGRKVATVLQSHTASGTHTIPFDASALVPGMYRYVLCSAEGVQSKWMTVVR